ncbi:MAG: cyclic nucleotide-binding domain-containing protein [Leptospiraceae bacterium]|nr:cyclic nucleotide-binding domain-containing protein [Leptospiraceae bacterium]
MALDTSKPNQKINVEAGLILFEEGSSANSLNIIHEGGYSVEKKIGDFPIQLFQVTGKNLTPGAVSLFTSGRYTCTIQSSQPSVLSTYQVTNATIKKTIISKMSLGVMIARTTLREIIELTKRANAIQALSATTEKTLDNLALIYYKLEPSIFKDIDLAHYTYSEDEYVPEPILRVVRKNLSNFIESGGILPEKPSILFVDEDHSELLKKTYQEEVDFEDEEYIFMRKILSLDPNIQTPIYEADVTIILQICGKFARVFENLVDIIEEEVNQLNTNLELLLGKESSLVEKYNLLLDELESGIADEKPEVIIPLAEYLAEKVEKILNSYKSIFFKEYPTQYPQVRNFIERAKSSSQKLSAESPKEDVAALVTAGLDMEAMKKDLAGSAQKIMSYAKTSQEQIKEFNALLLKLKSMKNPLDTESDARKIRKNIAKIYWETYTSAAQRYIETKSAPKQVEMMLMFGFMDETLLEPNQLAFLYTFKDETKAVRNIPVILCHEWLELIYQKKVPTSLDELGQTFFDKIKNEYKDQVFKKESDVPSSIDTNEARLKYEINAMYQPNVRLTTGNPASYLPVLTKYQINLPLDKSVVTRESVSSTVNEI